MNLSITKKLKAKTESTFFYNQETCQKAWDNATFKQKVMLLIGFVFFMSSQSMSAQSDAADEIQTLWEDQINPILNAVLGIAVGIAAVVVGIQFFQGKKEALKQLGYVIAGAVVIKVLSSIIKNILAGGANEI